MTSLQKVIKYCAIAFAALLIVSIIGGICSAVGLLSGLLNRGDAAGPTQSWSGSDSVQRLDLEISAADLRIRTGDRFQVESNHKYLTVTEKSGTLEISEENLPFGTSFNGVQVTITLPEGFTFEDVDMETGAGRVEISALSTETLSLELGAGETVIDALTVQTRGFISTGAGKLTIRDGQMRDLSLDQGVGKLELTGLLTGRCQADLGVGSAEFTLLGSRADYTISLDKGLGNATVDGEALSDGAIVGNGQHYLDISGGVGSIAIRFRDGK